MPAIPTIHLEEIDSTSREARRRLLAGGFREGPGAIVARRQSGGVGRFGRRWESPDGGVWMTVVWPLPDRPEAILDGLGLRLGLACSLTVEEILRGASCDGQVHLKWPNDVLVRGRKVLGVLTEVVSHDDRRAALIGVGVNVSFPVGALPEPLRAGATTLADEIGRPIEPAPVAQRLLHRIARAMTTEGLDAPTREAVIERLHGVGRLAKLRCADGSELEGTLLGLSDDGRVRIATDGGEALAPPGAELFVDPVLP